ncbi:MULTISPECIES: primosomal replication protein PriC [Providencia]|uniref:Primosomal replication protein n=1 Tax=Providencia stuartii TaxID=588 RepID=A0ABD5L691_PROST|nr:MULTISPECIES: primosomal replication protein [Providencia]ELR5043014.1 primosomal replication protein [Providencia rettgeri]ELR5290216.1 primosomal replication protein [Providencia stuartii]MCR4178607.1 primosomal replication protein [Providencia vermicola]URE79849.1 primosomal replication protein [Providencia stuartii]
MKIQALLDALKTQIDALQTRIAPIADQEFSHSRFDSQLFSTKSTHLGDCQKELNKLYQQLSHSVSLGHIEQVNFLTEKITHQIQALSRELSTQALRQKETSFQEKKEHVDLYERLAQHQDYERRLLAMVSERELQLNGLTDHVKRHQCQKDIAALAGRLHRCRQALIRIEKAIEHQENQFLD